MTDQERPLAFCEVPSQLGSRGGELGEVGVVESLEGRGLAGVGEGRPRRLVAFPHVGQLN